MPSLSRQDFVAAAQSHLQELVRTHDAPRRHDPDFADDDLASWRLSTRERIGEIEEQLRLNQFDREVEHIAGELAGASTAEPGTAEHLHLHQLAARVRRASLRIYLHQIKTPWAAYANDDSDLSWPPEATDAVKRTQPREAEASTTLKGITVATAVKEFLAYKAKAGRGHSYLDEMARSLDWLREVIGDDAALQSVSKDALREFRNGLEGLNRKLQGRGSKPFYERQTDNPELWISSVTSIKYWAAIKALYSWATAEGYIPDDLTLNLKIAPRKTDRSRTPEPFSPAELSRLFSSPLFAGHRSRTHILVPGDVLNRGSRWWAIVLALCTGMRAGEIAQLTPSDFTFEGLPVLKVRETDDQGVRSRSLKTASSTRSIPLHPNLMQYGLRDFVALRSRGDRSVRMFPEIRFGADGR